MSNAIALGQDSQAAMVELYREGQVMLDKSVPNIRVRSSADYSPNSVEDSYPTVDGTGVNIAIIDSGVDDGQHESLAEVWMSGQRGASTPPSKTPDRQEIVILTAQGYGTRKQKFLPIMRTGPGKFYGFGESSTLGSAEGRFTNILPCSTPNTRGSSTGQTASFGYGCQSPNGGVM